MKKSLQENIVKILDKARQSGEIQGVIVLKIIKFLKLPRGKPPIIDTLAIANKVDPEGEIPTHLPMLLEVAKAQLKSDIKWYENIQ